MFPDKQGCFSSGLCETLLRWGAHYTQDTVLVHDLACNGSWQGQDNAINRNHADCSAKVSQVVSSIIYEQRTHASPSFSRQLMRGTGATAGPAKR
jgi:hypothetical protein